jgi:hypothetical protein
MAITPKTRRIVAKRSASAKRRRIAESLTNLGQTLTGIQD